MNKAVLFDADGVLTISEEVFSVLYTKKYGLNLKPFENFFKTEWSEFVTGKQDLKKHIIENPDFWKWSGTADELLDYWFKSEDIKDSEMIDLVTYIRQSGTPCFLATEQEKYRGEYMKNTMFPNIFDGYFITAELGTKKGDPEFFKQIIQRLNQLNYNLTPSNLIFFDDSLSKVEAAHKAGINSHLFENIEGVKKILIEENIL